jgi:hypothetical protein
MKKIIAYILLGLIQFSSLHADAQNDERAEMQKNFQTYIKNEGLANQLERYKEISKEDERFVRVLPERIKLAIVLDDKEQFISDIKLLKGVTTDLADLFRYFNPHEFPPTEWERFYTLTETAAATNISDTTALLFLNSMRGNLAVLLLEPEISLEALTKVKSLINDSVFIPSPLFDHYLNALIKNNEEDEAISILKNVYADEPNSHFLFRLIGILYEKGEYAEIINYADEIKKVNQANLFELAMSYYHQGNKENQMKYMEKYARNFIINEQYVSISVNEATYLVPPAHLESIADLYFELEPKAACKYYKLAQRQSNSGVLFTLERYKMALGEKSEKYISFKEEQEKIKSKEAELQQKITKQLEACK